jgi:hypothetical protein
MDIGFNSRDPGVSQAAIAAIGSEWLRAVRVAKLHTARLGGGKCGLSTLRDLGALLLGTA